MLYFGGIMSDGVHSKIEMVSKNCLVEIICDLMQSDVGPLFAVKKGETPLFPFYFSV